MYDKKNCCWRNVHGIAKQSLIEELANRLYFIINKHYHGNMPILVGIKAHLYFVESSKNIFKDASKTVTKLKESAQRKKL